MLSSTDKMDIYALLSRLNTAPDGETVVANILRSIEAGIVPRELAVIILKAWCDKVRVADAASISGGHGPLSGEAALKYTESELLATSLGAPSSGSSLWSAIRNTGHDPFDTTSTDVVSNVKNLSTIMEHLIGVTDLEDSHKPGTPIALSHHTSPAMWRRQKNRIQKALRNVSSLKTGARIYHRRWFWVTTQSGLKTALAGLLDDSAATKAVDLLGLVHFSRNFATQSVADRYVVEVQLAPGFAPEVAKPSFIFADHNPRFVPWSDFASRADKKWGRAVDLEKYHLRVQLEQGGPEMIKATPDQLVVGDVAGFRVLGYLDVNRWGVSSVAEGTEVFADRLRLGRSKAEVVDTIISLLG